MQGVGCDVDAGRVNRRRACICLEEPRPSVERLCRLIEGAVYRLANRANEERAHILRHGLVTEWATERFGE